MNIYQHNLEYSISKKTANRIGVLLSLTLLVILNLLAPLCYSILCFVFFYIFLKIICRYYWNGAHECLHKIGFSYNEPDADIKIVDAYTKVNSGISVSSYIRGLCFPAIVHIIFILLVGMILSNLKDAIISSFKFEYNTYLNVTFFTFFNPLFYGVTDFMFDIFFAIHLYLKTRNVQDDFKVITPANLTYGYVLIPKDKTEKER